MNWITLGLVARPHGIRGAFVLSGQSNLIDNLPQASSLYLRNTSLHGPFTLSEVAPLNRGWKIHFTEFSSIDSIATFKGASVCIEREKLITQSNEFLIGDVMGAAAVENGIVIGHLINVESIPNAPDRWWIELLNGEQFPVPAVKQFIDKVDLELDSIEFKNTWQLR